MSHKNLHKIMDIAVLLFLAISLLLILFYLLNSTFSVQGAENPQSKWIECQGWEKQGYLSTECRKKALRRAQNGSAATKNIPFYNLSPSPLPLPPSGIKDPTNPNATSGSDLAWYNWGMTKLSVNFLGQGSSCGMGPSANECKGEGPTNTPRPTRTPRPTLTPSITPTPGTPTPTIDAPTPTPEEEASPWIASSGGSFYARSIEQAVPNFNSIPQYLSDGLFILSSSSGLPQRSSQRSFDIEGYNDSSSKSSEYESWFDFFETTTFQNSEQVINLQNPSISDIEKLSEIPEIPGEASVDKPLLISFSNEQNFKFDICDRKAIILVNGNISLEPNLKIEGSTNGCTFISNQTITVLEGEDSIGVYDEIQAFLIANEFVSVFDPDYDGLKIKGGVVANSFSLNRDLDSERNKTLPSELFEHDPRYIYIYDKVLNDEINYSIRETQYIKSLQ